MTAIAVRRHGPATLAEALERIDDLEFELAELKRQAMRAPGEAVRVALMKRRGFTPYEAKFLEALYQAAPRAMSKEAIFNALYNGEDDRELKIVDVFLCKIRAKIGDVALITPNRFGGSSRAYTYIETVWAHGYMLTPGGVELVRSIVAEMAQ